MVNVELSKCDFIFIIHFDFRKKTLFFCCNTKYYHLNVVITKLFATRTNVIKNNDIEINDNQIYNRLIYSCLRFGISDTLLHQGG